jgi:glyoxylate/hydroxypyruvate reductase A
LLHRADGKTEPWIKTSPNTCPKPKSKSGTPEKCQACDYAVVWSPPEAMLAELATVKAIFVTGAGVDALLKFGDALPPTSPSSAWKTRAWRCRWPNT